MIRAIAHMALAAVAGCGGGDRSPDGPGGGLSQGPDSASEPAGGATATIEVAVAANFYAAFGELAAAFTAESGIPVRAAVGSTGQLYAQILNGAPYHVFLAADSERPRRLEAEGAALPGTRAPYAVGRLALYAPRLAPLPSDPLELLDRPGVVAAWANPRTAPYGAAARAVLAATGRGGVQGARGESVGQAFQFVESGAADVGFVALSQVVDRPPDQWTLISSELHPSLVQEAVLLESGTTVAGARLLLEFLTSPSAREILARRGYEPPPVREPAADPIPSQ